ncbi:hypothetical protein ANAPC2_01328 [Anaplasma phagocytophilum]|nr:hypothetical protein ANAPC2_01328 [Anaplasma phagocytophilum]
MVLKYIRTPACSHVKPRGGFRSPAGQRIHRPRRWGGGRGSWGRGGGVGCGGGVLLWLVRFFSVHSFHPVHHAKRSASHRPSPAVLDTAFFLLCLLRPPDFLLLLAALHVFEKAHALSMSPCWRTGDGSVVSRTSMLPSLA